MADRVIVIHYAPNPPIITARVRQLVEEIFQECLEPLAEIKDVAIFWQRGLAPRGSLGGNGGIFSPSTEWNINVGTGLRLKNACGQSGGWGVELNPANINATASKAGGDPEIVTANTIAHEIGVHVLGGRWTHWCSNDEPLSVDQGRFTPELARAKGSFSPDCCSYLMIGLNIISGDSFYAP